MCPAQEHLSAARHKEVRRPRYLMNITLRKRTGHTLYDAPDVVHSDKSLGTRGPALKRDGLRHRLPFWGDEKVLDWVGRCPTV